MSTEEGESSRLRSEKICGSSSSSRQQVQGAAGLALSSTTSIVPLGVPPWSHQSGGLSSPRRSSRPVSRSQRIFTQLLSEGLRKLGLHAEILLSVGVLNRCRSHVSTNRPFLSLRCCGGEAVLTVTIRGRRWAANICGWSPKQAAAGDESQRPSLDAIKSFISFS